MQGVSKAPAASAAKTCMATKRVGANPMATTIWSAHRKDARASIRQFGYVQDRLTELAMEAGTCAAGLTTSAIWNDP